MTKLIITADLHGSYTAWLTVKNLLTLNDVLVIAGDLFDTKYGDFSDSDFQPDSIREELIRFEHLFYYVYGNCDTPSFFPGYTWDTTFNIFNKTIYLSHGHHSPATSENVDIIIQGHTHRYALNKKGSHIFMNPGSIASPRNGKFTYGIIEKTSAGIIDLRTGKELLCVHF